MTRERCWIALVLGFWIAILTNGLYYLPVAAKDVGQWDSVNNAPEVREWYRGLMRPDTGYWTSSCCGDADAYWCDDISVKHGHTFCAITDTRDDGPLHRPHRPIGEVHEIPPEKMKFGPDDPQRDKRSNPTGHSIIFLASGGTVYCFVPNGGV